MFRLIRMSVLGLSLLLLAAPKLKAQPAAALPVAQFVDESTVLVADVNIAAVDLDAARNWLSALLKQGGLPADQQADFERESKNGIGVAKEWQTKFAKAGGTHMFIVVSVSQQTPVFLVFPAGAGANADALKQLFSKGGGLPEDMLHGTAVETVGNMVVFGPPEAVKQAKDVAANPQRTPRPDLAAAYAAAGAAPHRLALALPEQLKGAVIIQQPNLPPELGGGTTAPVLNAFKFGYVALTTPTAASPKVNAKIVIQAKDAEGAAKLKNVADAGTKSLREQMEKSKVPVSPELLDKLVPQVAGDQLVVELDQTKLEAASKAFVTTIARAREQAQRIKSMSNMRQILMGNMMYANENKGNLPNKLPDDVAAYLAGAGDNRDALKQMFTNPVNGRYPGYIYVKPAQKIMQLQNPSQTVLLYEAYDHWPQGGIGVGFADGHVEGVADEAAFKKMLENK